MVANVCDRHVTRCVSAAGLMRSWVQSRMALTPGCAYTDLLCAF